MKADVGSRVKHRNVTESNMAGQAFKTENTTTKTLTKKDEAGLALAVETDMGGNV